MRLWQQPPVSSSTTTHRANLKPNQRKRKGSGLFRAYLQIRALETV
jgi:hypothetical protein